MKYSCILPPCSWYCFTQEDSNYLWNSAIASISQHQWPDPKRISGQPPNYCDANNTREYFLSFTLTDPLKHRKSILFPQMAHYSFIEVPNILHLLADKLFLPQYFLTSSLTYMILPNQFVVVTSRWLAGHLLPCQAFEREVIQLRNSPGSRRISSRIIQPEPFPVEGLCLKK